MSRPIRGRIITRCSLVPSPAYNLLANSRSSPMSHLVQQKSSIWHVILVAAAAVVSAALTAPTRADVIMDWNAKADEIAAEKQLGFPHNRAVVLLHIAMFEAVNAIDRRYVPYKLDLKADRGTSKEAAAASAGYEIMIALY